MKGCLRSTYRPPIQVAAGKLCRFMTVKAPNRAAVHGSRLPVTDNPQHREKLETEIEKAKAERERKRKEIEETIDSKLKSDSDSP